MVSRPTHLLDEHLGHRQSTRNFGLPYLHERPNSVKHGAEASHGLQLPFPQDGSHDGQENAAPVPKRRVSMACGRCRQRKIRCSGDPGNGNACDTCKSAGRDDCAFLRMHAHPTSWKFDHADAYHAASAREQQRLALLTYPVHGYQSISPSANDGMHTYCHTPFSPYNYPTRSMSEGQIYDYSDDQAPYGIQPPAHHIGEQLSAQKSPTWISNARPAGNVIYMGQEPAYHGQIQQHSDDYPMRHIISQQPKSYQISNIVSPMPSSAISTGSDRVLPFPTGRSACQVNSFVRCETESPLGMDGTNPPMTGLLGPAIRNMNALSIETQPQHLSNHNCLASNSGSDTDQSSPLTHTPSSRSFNTPVQQPYVESNAWICGSAGASDAHYIHGPAGGVCRESQDGDSGPLPLPPQISIPSYSEQSTGPPLSYTSSIADPAPHDSVQAMS